MSFLPLTLGVGRTPEAGGGGAKPPSKADAEKIFKRDDFTCRFCGFRSTRYQRITNSPEGLVVACSFCEQVTGLDRAGLQGTGLLIWLPEITQTDLHHIMRAIYVARAASVDAGADPSTKPVAEWASRAYDALVARRPEAKKRLGSDDPLLLATILHENLSEAERAEAVRKLDGVRLMPLDKQMVRSKSGDTNGFPQIVKFWRSDAGPFSDMPTATWQAMFEKLAA